ncbi:MAG: LysR family transcriptional regulator [Bradyrhizobium sp.]|nr:LysR family transcriptional regulator [Bradyrhizobium sp.]
MEWSERIGRNLRPRDLHVFLTVVEEGNMAKAADRLAISRPVVSKTIAALERALDVRLLDRIARGVEPTIYGHALVKRSAAVFDELRQGVKEIEFLSNPEEGELRVGCTEVWAAGLVPAAIERLVQRYPGVKFHVELSTAPLQFNLLRDRKCELVVARLLTDVQEVDLDIEPLFFEQLRVVAGAGNKWARRPRVGLAELIDEPWILSPFELERGSPLVDAVRALGLSVPKPRILSNSLNLRNTLLAGGRYLTLVPGSVIEFGPSKPLFKVLPVELPRWQRPLAVFRLKNRTLSPVAQLFIECIRQAAKPLTGQRR